MSGTVPFIALRPCGCVFSEAAVRAVIPNLTRGVPAKSSSAATDEAPDAAQPVVEKKESEVVACPNCGKDILPTESGTVSPINPSREVQEDLLEQLLLSRAAAKAGKKRKAGAMASKGESNGVSGEGDVKAVSAGRNGTPAESEAGPLPKQKAARTTATPAPAPTINTLDPGGSGRQSVAQKLAAQEQKRLAAQAGMSDAVKSMFKGKESEKTGGAADFFGRTFNRVSICFSDMLWKSGC